MPVQFIQNFCLFLDRFAELRPEFGVYERCICEADVRYRWACVASSEVLGL
ncbi:hypothetical protein D918_03546 [Trichuris suis]|nr:hypothetical protein D918_03546 [Trichuris suis]